MKKRVGWFAALLLALGVTGCTSDEGGSGMFRHDRAKDRADDHFRYEQEHWADENSGR